MKKSRSRLLIFISISMVVFIMFRMVNRETENPNPKPVPVAVKKADINSRLPYSLEVEEEAVNIKPESVAYRIWSGFVNSLESDGTLVDARYLRFTKLSEDVDSFVFAVVFEVHLPEGTQEIDYGWGKMQDNQVVPNIVWKLTINRVGDLTYTLTNIERTTDTQIGLPPVETWDEYLKNAGIKEPSESIRYEIMDETLRVTYDNGKNWQVVPVAFEELFGIGYNGSKKLLLDGSYVITPEKTAFVLEENIMGISEIYTKLRVLISNDKGESWNTVLVSDKLPPLRMRILGFTSDQEGFLIFTGDKTMSWEANFVFKTNDGGQSWYNVGPVDDVFSLVTDGGFINDQLGFISFGEYRLDAQPPTPNLYRTTDGGANWERVEVPIPQEYQGYFTIAEIPIFDGTEGTLLVNQGQVGDYMGGKVLAKFTSLDQGKKWAFAGLIDPDRVLRAR
jgi:photosystem II stability/assembly factor-like uncharacterized protein